MTTTQDTDRFLAERFGFKMFFRCPFCEKTTAIEESQTICSICTMEGYWYYEASDGHIIDEWTPSTCITNALGDGSPQTVVGKMRERGWWLSLYESPANEYGWYAEFRSGKKIVQAFAITPAAAVSSASRKALEGEG